MKDRQRLAAAIMFVLTFTGCPSVKRPASAKPQNPDKVLYDRGMDAFAAQRYGVGIVLLETLVATYPQSQYAEPGKQALQNCDHLEACASARPAVEHGGGMTFFPNIPVPSSHSH